MQKADLFLTGVRKGASRRNRRCESQTTGRQVKPHPGSYTQLSLTKDQCKGKKGCWVDHEREKSVFLALLARKKKKPKQKNQCEHMSILCKDIKINHRRGAETGSLSKREASKHLLGGTWIIYASTCITQLNSRYRCCTQIQVFPGTTQHSVYSSA